MSNVIGFMSYTDFLNEVKARVSTEIIRVQPYYKAKGDSQFGGVIQHYTFAVEAAVIIGTSDGRQAETLVCRFITAQTTAMGKEDREKIDKLNQRNFKAAEILESDLQKHGFNVGRGQVAESEHSKTEADPGALLTKLKIDNPDQTDSNILL